ncbi:MAG: RHS repeat-associated core domain-containing protein [Micromonosporaceae bacterium]|nr:RHS repeat-associated core domain-containing protein [Micromonosporaceae bacterium]
MLPDHPAEGTPDNPTEASATGPVLRLLGHGRTYFDGAAYDGLPLGVLGDHGMPVRVESLAFTEGFLRRLFDPDDPGSLGPRPPYLDPTGPVWPAEYPADFQAATPALAGYRHFTDTDVPGSPGGYYLETQRHRYDVQGAAAVARGLPVGSLDPFGAQRLIDYDQHDLLPVREVDPLGLQTSAGYDYRVLSATETVDANGNVHAVAYSPAGLVAAQFVRGKNGEGDGSQPSVRIAYDLLAFDQRHQPASVRTTTRVHHDTDTAVPAEQRDDVIVSVQYCDGFGRVVQHRSQAEDVLFGDEHFGGAVIPAGDLAPVGDSTGRTPAVTGQENVTVSGSQVYDNKGRVVQQYEAFFATGYDYDPPTDAQVGQKTTFFYDPRGHIVRTVHPDGSEHRIVLGIPADLTDPDSYTPTPWETYTYDSNDNAGRTHGEAAGAYRSHWNTPTSTEVDALGRAVRAVARAGTGASDQLVTVTAYDIQGNLLAVTDPLGRPASRYVYDLIRRRWRVDSIDAGRHDSVLDPVGSPLETRDSKGSLALGAFDLAHRPTRVWARDTPAAAVSLRQMVEYGDGGTPDQPAAQRAAARAANLLGRQVRHRDEAGLLTVAAADFKGNLLEQTRQVIADAPILASYATAAQRGWRIDPFTVDWAPASGQSQDARDAELLETTGYTTTTSYDAIDRIALHIFPADVEGQRRRLQPVYNRAGGLEAISLDGTAYVRRIAHDAKGQRVLVAYGNGVMTRYAYDPHTFRLARMRTEAYTNPDPLTYHPVGPALQDCGYDYDLAGNILTVRDRTPGSGIRNNPEALGAADPVLSALLGSGDALDRRFGYDPIYRLLSATGREYSSPPAGDPWSDQPRGADITLAQAYNETYQYDAADNLLSLTHGSTGGFTRTATIAAGNNRLTRMTVGSTPFDYSYDANGNLTAESTSRHFTWDHADRLKAFATQVEGAEPSLHAQYLYDVAGNRVKKLVRRQGGAVEVTHYIHETFEHHRWATDPSGANNHVHVMDSTRRLALVRIGPAAPGDTGPAVAFHLADHLGSSVAVMDETGAVTNREEYTPYGETSFGSYARKRYRFTGSERDEESGLAYHGLRYLMPWTGRWSTYDPLAQYPGRSGYTYASANPIARVDPNGGEDRTVVISNQKATGRESPAVVRAAAAKAGWVVTGTISWHHPDAHSASGHWYATGLVPVADYARSIVDKAFANVDLSALTGPLGADGGSASSGSGDGTGVGKGADVVTAVASLIVDPGSLHDAKSARSGDGSPLGRAGGPVGGWLAKVMTVGLAIESIFGIDRIVSATRRVWRSLGSAIRGLRSRLLPHAVLPTPRGHATVHIYKGPHASIEVSANGKAVHTHRVGAQGQNTTPVYFDEDTAPRRSFKVELPDAEKAQTFQHEGIGRNDGPYDLQTRSCVTYCGEVLREGGQDVPATTFSLLSWLQRHGVEIK